MRTSERDRGFSPWTLGRESRANLRANAGFSVAALLVAALCGAFVPTVALFEVGGIVRENDGQAEAGQNVFSVSGVDRVPISATRCEQLNAADGVLAAGGIHSRESLYPLARPSEPIQIVHGTAGLPFVIWPSESVSRGIDASVVAGSSVAGQLGISPGADMMFSTQSGFPFHPEQTWSIEQVADPSPRDEAFDRTLIAVSPPIGTVTECLVEATTGARPQIEAILTGWFPPDTPTIVSPYYLVSEVGVSPQEALDSRLSQWSPAVGFLVLSVTLGLMWTARRSDFALYSSFGLRPSQLLGVLYFEFAIVGLTPVLFGLAASTLIAPTAVGSLTGVMVAWDAARFVSLCLLVPLFAFAALYATKSADTLRGR